MSAPLSEANREAAFPTLTDRQIGQLRGYGSERSTEAGEVIFSAGDEVALVLVLDGRVGLFDRKGGTERRMAQVGAGQFVGELGLLTGQDAIASCIVEEAGRVLVVTPDAVQDAIESIPSLGDVLIRAFFIRRQLLLRAADTSLLLIGPDRLPRLLSVEEFLSRNHIPYRWLAPDDPAAMAVLERLAPGKASAVWAIVRDEIPIADATPLKVAEALGLDLALDETELVDVLVVGAGPAGLSAAVYGASEGLQTIVVDNVGVGGQAGASSRIENYLGFPTGISGGELAFRAEVQALKFGARITVPSDAIALRRRDGLFELELDHGNALLGRSVVIATGARYRTLGLAKENKLGGIYYSATKLEARTCGDDTVVVVGGGNSAGQAAMFLTEHVREVHLIHRRDNLDASMSHYLIARLEQTPNVVLHMGTEVEELHGNEQLESVTLRDSSGGQRTIATTGLFVMIGANPCTAWLRDVVALDRKGFVLTGMDLPPSEHPPHSPFETSQPGIYAVGDVRSGSIKRVASAVGEGSVVISAIHQYLADS